MSLEKYENGKAEEIELTEKFQPKIGSLLEKKEKPKTKYFIQYLASISASLLVLSSGNHTGWLGPTYIHLKSENSTIAVSNTEGSWLASALELGAIVGPIISAIGIDYLGRKTTILLAAIPNIVGAILFSVATNVTMLFIGRFICGISMGAGRTIVCIYIAEIASPEIRGRLSSFIFVQFSLGILLEFSVAPFISIEANSYFLMSIPAICVLTFMWMPESPYYYIMKNNINAAKKSLIILRGRDDVNDELTQIEEAVVKEQREKGGILELIRIRSNRKAMIIVLMILSELKFSGVSAIVTYAQVIFKEFNSSISPAISGIIFATIPFIGSWVHGLVVDSWGRRPLLISACFSLSICLLIIGSYLYFIQIGLQFVASVSLIPVIALFAFQLIQSVGVTPLTLMCVGELFPTNVKAVASCVSRIYQSTMGFAVTKMFQVIIDISGIYVVFWIFAVCSALAGIFMVLYMPETKRLTLEQVQEQLKSKKKKAKHQNPV